MKLSQCASADCTGEAVGLVMLVTTMAWIYYTAIQYNIFTVQSPIGRVSFEGGSSQPLDSSSPPPPPKHFDKEIIL